VRRYTIAAVGKIAPERARAKAKVILGSVAHGHDPAGQKTTERGIPTVAELADRFMAEHVEPKRKPGTADFYRDILNRTVKPAVGTTKADKLSALRAKRGSADWGQKKAPRHSGAGNCGKQLNAEKANPCRGAGRGRPRG
jgi:hypothetical protein